MHTLGLDQDAPYLPDLRYAVKLRQVLELRKSASSSEWIDSISSVEWVMERTLEQPCPNFSSLFFNAGAQKTIDDRIYKRLPARFYYVLGDPDSGPYFFTITTI